MLGAVCRRQCKAAIVTMSIVYNGCLWRILHYCVVPYSSSIRQPVQSASFLFVVWVQHCRHLCAVVFVLGLCYEYIACFFLITIALAFSLSIQRPICESFTASSLSTKALPWHYGCAVFLRRITVTFHREEYRIVCGAQKIVCYTRRHAGEGEGECCCCGGRRVKRTGRTYITNLGSLWHDSVTICIKSSMLWMFRVMDQNGGSLLRVCGRNWRGKKARYTRAPTGMCSFECILYVP